MVSARDLHFFVYLITTLHVKPTRTLVGEAEAATPSHHHTIAPPTEDSTTHKTEDIN